MQPQSASNEQNLAQQLSPLGQQLYSDVSQLTTDIRNTKDSIQSDEHVRNVISNLNDLMSQSIRKTASTEEDAAVREMVDATQSLLELAKTLMVKKEFRKTILESLHVLNDMITIKIEEEIDQDEKENNREVQKESNESETEETKRRDRKESNPESILQEKDFSSTTTERSDDQLPESEDASAQPSASNENSDKRKWKLPKDQMETLATKSQNILRLLLQEKEFEHLHEHSANLFNLISRWISNNDFIPSSEENKEAHSQKSIPENVKEVVYNVKLFLEARLSESKPQNVSLDPWTRSVKQILKNIQTNPIWTHLYSLYARSVKEPSFVESQEWANEVSRFVEKMTQQLQQHKEQVQNFVEETVCLMEQFPTPAVFEDAQQIQSHLWSIAQSALQSPGERSNIRESVQHDMMVLLHSLTDALANVSIPRIEIKNDDYHLVVDNLNVACDKILPKQIKLQVDTELDVPDLSEMTLSSTETEPVSTVQNSSLTASTASPTEILVSSQPPSITATTETNTITATTISLPQSSTSGTGQSAPKMPQMSQLVHLHLSDIEAKAINFTWLFFKKTGLLSAGDVGLADVEIKKMQLDITTYPFEKQPSESHPRQCECKVEDLEFTIHGTKHDWVYAILKPLLYTLIKSVFEENVKKTVLNAINIGQQGMKSNYETIGRTLDPFLGKLEVGQ